MLARLKRCHFARTLTRFCIPRSNGTRFSGRNFGILAFGVFMAVHLNIGTGGRTRTCNMGFGSALPIQSSSASGPRRTIRRRLDFRSSLRPLGELCVCQFRHPGIRKFLGRRKRFAHRRGRVWLNGHQMPHPVAPHADPLRQTHPRLLRARTPRREVAIVKPECR